MVSTLSRIAYKSFHNENCSIHEVILVGEAEHRRTYNYHKKQKNSKYSMYPCLANIGSHVMSNDGPTFSLVRLLMSRKCTLSPMKLYTWSQLHSIIFCLPSCINPLQRKPPKRRILELICKCSKTDGSTNQRGKAPEKVE